ncbi:MAG TPA: hypothetical protein VM223_11995 [Planctomycetota bacterium]|nr:hypothetical protein [Planctomycetota bacterium]
MAKCIITHGATSVIRHVRALDAAETDGSGKTGLAFGDFTAKYVKPGGTLVSLTTETIGTLGTYAAPTSNAHIRIKELAAAAPTEGVYEIHFHNDWFASGEIFTLFISATDMGDLALEMQLDAPPATAAALTTHDGKLDTVDANVDSILADTGTAGVVVAAASKTGYALSATGLDTVATTAPTGVASNFREMVVQTWRRLFKKSTLTATQLKTYADNGTDVLTTQTVSDDATTQTQGVSA